MKRPAPRLPVLAATLAAAIGLCGTPAASIADGAEPSQAKGPSSMPEDSAAVILAPPEAAERGGVPLVVLRLGPLPPGAAVTVADADGTILGGYAPFGAGSGDSVTRIPLTTGWPDAALTLRIWVEEDDGTRRAPTEAELLSVDIEGMEATR